MLRTLVAFLLLAQQGRVAVWGLSLPSLQGRALVVQNKGGGHGTIGFSLCQQLRAAHPGLHVTLLQDKCNLLKEPFSSYPQLEAAGVTIIHDTLSQYIIAATEPEAEGGAAPTPASARLPPALAGQTFDFIVDNWSKKEADAELCIALAQAHGGSTNDGTSTSGSGSVSACRQVLYVSSGGMYKGGDAMPQVEGSEVKTNDARKVRGGGRGGGRGGWFTCVLKRGRGPGEGGYEW